MDNERTSNLPAVTGGQATHCSASFEKPKPASPVEFAKALGPILTLVAPSGMSEDERVLWLEAARLALSDISAVNLKWAVSEAMRTVDHPSKIVPAIRKAMDSGYKPTATIFPPEPLLTYDDPAKEKERQEVAKLMANLVKRMEANNEQ